MELKNNLFQVQIFRTKQDVLSNHSDLNRCLTGLDLVLLGIGAIIGAGIFVITGVAAATQAGPAITISYLIAGIACSFAALAYAELASSIGGSGSAYTYSYIALGEIFAWFIGWDLILEYALGCCTVSIGWSGYLNDALNGIGIFLPNNILKTPTEGGFINLPATLIVLLLGTILALGIKLSARFNATIVIIKLVTISVFVLTAIHYFNIDNWHPFMPFGWSGVVQGAALVFFAYIGFDAISTAAEETIHPQRDLTIGIIGSFVICSLLYIIVSGLLTGITEYTLLNVKSPVASSILKLGHNFISALISVGAIAGLTSVMLIFIYAQTRIFYAMARDGLIPDFFAKVHPKTQTPLRIIFGSSILIALMAGFLPLKAAAELVNIGTLAAFVLVCIGVIVLRIKKPDMSRPFKTPLSPLIPILGIGMCIYLMLSLPTITWLRFFIWLIIGMIVYFSFSIKNSKLSLR